MKNRLDKELVLRKMVKTRSQAENFIGLGKVFVNGKKVTKNGYFVTKKDKLELKTDEIFVSRAGLKLASVARDFKLDFEDKIVLDVGSSTGGFSQFSLEQGAQKIYAVDVGTDQMDKILRLDPRIELYEKTDIKDFYLKRDLPDLILIDVSFISVRQILPHISDNLTKKGTKIVLMLKPQFEADKSQLNKGVIKNKTIRRQILADFEQYISQKFKIINKKDSQVAGKHGNIEKFYLLEKF